MGSKTEILANVVAVLHKSNSYCSNYVTVDERFNLKFKINKCFAPSIHTKVVHDKMNHFKMSGNSWKRKCFQSFSTIPLLK